MSAIFGIFNLNGRPADRAILDRMAETMAHRGPDAVEKCSEGPVALGHAMLRTTPEARFERQPYRDAVAGLIITADARIDNRRELADELGIREGLQDGLPDSRLILAAYLKWGEDCIRHFNGDFAFVVWDRGQQKLFAARDHLGIKPFYYHSSGNLFVFASEARAILTDPRVPPAVNEPRIADFLVISLEGIDTTSTFYERVLRLPPAHTLTVTARQTVTGRYWEPDPEFERSLASDALYIEQFRELFTESVRTRLRCSGKPAAMLSGGIDSSSVVGLTRKLVGQENTGPLRVYSGISDVAENCPESFHIQQVIDQGGLEPVLILPADFERYYARLQGLLNHLAEPFDAAMMLMIVFYILAKESDHRVMLDGLEGDMVHSLSPSYSAFLLQHGHRIFALREIHGLWKNYYRQRIPFAKLLLQNGLAAFTPDILRKLKRVIIPQATVTANHHPLINRDFAEHIELGQRLEKLASHRNRSANCSLREMQVQEILHPYLTVGLERYDRIAALCSVEPRHPLLDRRLVEYSVSLPWNLKVRNGWSKYIARCCAEDTLPESVCWRRGWEQIGWKFTSAFIKGNYRMISETIAGQKERLQLYIDKNVLNNLQRKYSNFSSREQEKVWTIFSLALWLEQNR